MSLDNSIFLIADSVSNKLLGTGFLVNIAGESYIVSAAHVVADAMLMPRNSLIKGIEGSVNVFFPLTDDWLTADLTSFISPYEDNDIAILKIDVLPDKCIPLCLVASDNCRGHKFFSLGIRDAGTQAQGTILGHELIRRNDRKYRRLELSSSNIDGGMSGSPIIDSTNSLVVGMVVSTWHSKTNKDQYMAYGVTTETIKKIFPMVVVFESDLIDFRLSKIADKIIQRYEMPPNSADLISGIGVDVYVDMTLWEYGADYADETKLQFSWLSSQEKKIARKQGILSESAVNYLVDWQTSDEKLNLVLLAEFGMGKSTLLRRFEYLRAKQYPEYKKNFSLRFPLGHIKKGMENNSFLERISVFIKNDYGVDLSVREMESIFKNGKCTLLLDSFDEMAISNVPGNQMLGVNNIVKSLRPFDNLRFLIASRDNYFYGNGDIKELFRNSDPFFHFGEFNIIYLRGFGQEEIKSYLCLRLGERAQLFWGELQKINNLPDLARRPILLLMMTILEKQVLSGKIRTKQELYREFVRVWLKRERLNGRINLADKVILKILHTLAENVSLSRGKAFPQEEIDELLIRNFGYSRLDAESLGADFKVCCFLGRDQQDYYQFLHDSFREFFFALALKNHINNKDIEILKTTFISVEVTKFLIDDVNDKEEIGKFLQSIIAKNKGEDYLLTNSMMLYEMMTKKQESIGEFYSTLPCNRIIENFTYSSLPNDFVTIPSGHFLMGTWHGRPDETPVHCVEIDKFAIQRYPVTNKEFVEFVKDTNYITEAEISGEGRIWTGNKWQVIRGLSWKNPRPDNINLVSRLDHPVVQVSWQDAVEFCKWRSSVWNLLVELPSEAEWEYSCRAGSLDKWCFGNNESLLIDFGWYTGNQREGEYTQPVGLKNPNKWGIYDMHGNVREWCNDVYDKYPGNNLNWDLGDRYFSSSGEIFHILRGGHFGSVSGFLRSGVRVSGKDGLSTDYTGFRLKVRLK